MKNNLKKYRIKAEYTQEEAAHHISLASSNRLSEWEAGKSKPDIINLFKLSALYKTHSQQLYSDDYILAKSSVYKKPIKKREIGILLVDQLEPVIEKTDDELLDEFASIIGSYILSILEKDEKPKNLL